jgi:hypothetical protein
MVTSELRDGIVWLTIEGEMVSQEIIGEVEKWLSQKNAFIGFITDLRRMTAIPSMYQQRELEEWRKQNRSGKPHALLGRTNALGTLVQIYIRFTRAEDTRYFMKPEAAVAWVKNFDQR